jgi:pyruvate kinase
MPAARDHIDEILTGADAAKVERGDLGSRWRLSGSPNPESHYPASRRRGKFVIYRNADARVDDRAPHAYSRRSERRCQRSRYRPPVRVYTITPIEIVARQLLIHYGVQPVLARKSVLPMR